MSQVRGVDVAEQSGSHLLSVQHGTTVVGQMSDPGVGRINELPELPEQDNGYPVYAKCKNCGINLTIDDSQRFVHVSTYDRSCRITRLAKPDRHQRWAT